MSQEKRLAESDGTMIPSRKRRWEMKDEDSLGDRLEKDRTQEEHAQNAVLCSGKEQGEKVGNAQYAASTRAEWIKGIVNKETQGDVNPLEAIGTSSKRPRKAEEEPKIEGGNQGFK